MSTKSFYILPLGILTFRTPKSPCKKSHSPTWRSHVEGKGTETTWRRREAQLSQWPRWAPSDDSRPEVIWLQLWETPRKASRRGAQLSWSTHRMMRENQSTVVCYMVINNKITISGTGWLTNETLPHICWTQSTSEVSIPKEAKYGPMIKIFLPFTEGNHWKGFILLPLAMNWLFWELDKGSPLGILWEGAGVTHWLGRDSGTSWPRHSWCL